MDNMARIVAAMAMPRPVLLPLRRVATIPAIANGRAMVPRIAAKLLTIGTQLISTAMLESTRPVIPSAVMLLFTRCCD